MLAPINRQLKSVMQVALAIAAVAVVVLWPGWRVELQAQSTYKLEVLCANPSGSVFVRTQCKGNERQLDSVDLGLGGISGYQIVAHQEFLAPGTFANVHVECPPGKKVLGGGFGIETPDDVKVFSSEPSDGQGNLIDHGWDVFVHNAGRFTRQTTVSAICASAK